MSGDEFGWFVGIDWASTEHEVRLLDASGTDLGRRGVAHTGAGLAELVSWLREVSGGSLEQVAVAIELTRGAVIDAVRTAGAVVFAINPKQLDRFRDRYTVAGAKDDRRDAFVLADTLRTDRGRYRRLDAEDPQVVAIRALVEARDELTEELTRLSSRLRAQLAEYYPQLLALCPAADEPWLWALLELAPTPADGARLRPSRVTQLLRDHRIRRYTAATVVGHLREPALPVTPASIRAASTRVGLLVPRLRLAHTQHTRCAQQLTAALDALTSDDPESDAALLRSLPGVGDAVSAAVLVEAQALLAARDYAALRTHAGLAPITRRSGTRHTVSMRRACSARLRQAMYYWALGSIKHDLQSRAIYRAARERGQSHGRALRGLANRLVRILMAILRTRRPYDPAYRIQAS
jgi:transposase